MAKFIYTARDIATGGMADGELDAADERMLALDLKSKGLIMTSSRLIDERTQVSFFDRFRTVPLKERMVFTRNLGVMVGSGLTVSHSIRNLAVQTWNSRFRTMLGAVATDVESGKSLSASLAAYPAVFNELFVSMIYTGEISGNLERVLDILAVQMGKEYDLMSKVRGALLYPSVVFVAMIGIGILMLTYVLPKITGVFREMEVALPPTTVFIVGLSDFLQEHVFFVMTVFFGLIIGTRLFARTESGRRFFGYLALRVPVISDITVKVNCARFSRMYSALLTSGISVTSALTIVSKTLSNVYYRDVLLEGVAEIQKGVELSLVVGRHPDVFPVLVPQMLSVGEETGKTDIVLGRLAEFYEEEVNQITKNLSSILEPILMLCIGSTVGVFAVAMLQPMYSILDTIK